MQGNVLWKSKKYQIICGIVVVFLLAVIIVGWKQTTIERRINVERALLEPHETGEKGQNKGVFLVGNPAKLRDPFHLKRPREECVRTAVLAMRQNPVKMNVAKTDFLLTGIAASGTERIAIIESGRKSGLYREHEQIGGYEVLRIGEDTVVLAKNKDDYIELRVMRE